VQLISKIYNLCGPDPRTLQTDGRTHTCTDDMRLQNRALQHSAPHAKTETKYRHRRHCQFVTIADNVSLKYRDIID